MNFFEKLEKRQEDVDSLVCVGLDTDEKLIPISSTLGFNKAIIDATNRFVCTYKLNIAFYSVSGWMESILQDTIYYIHREHPDIPVILDAKRGDIGNTADRYVKEVFKRFEADAVTVNPYLGQDGCQPFLNQKDKGIFILSKTSNPDAKEFQDLKVFVQDTNVVVPGIGNYWPLWKYVAYRVSNFWNENGNCALVVGATYPEELGEVRKVVGDMMILVPGVGDQVGDLESVMRNGLNSKGGGLLINSSRKIIYASKKDDFAKVAAKAAQDLRDEINRLKGEIKNG